MLRSLFAVVVLSSLFLGQAMAQNHDEHDKEIEAIENHRANVQKTLDSHVQRMEKQEINSQELLKSLKNFSSPGMSNNNRPPSEMIGELLKVPQELSDQELADKLMEVAFKKKAHTFFVDHPKVLTFVVMWIKDSKALVEFTKIVEDKDRLIKFSMAIFCTWILGLLLRFKKKAGGKRAIPWIFRFLIIWLLRMSVIAAFFHKELGPTLKIARHVYNSDFVLKANVPTPTQEGAADQTATHGKRPLNPYAREEIKVDEH